VVAGVTDSAAGVLQRDARRLVRIGDGRYAIELPPEVPPDRVLAALTAAGGTLVSLNPIRDTLEDYFVRQVTGQAPLDRGLGESRAAAEPA
jgi:hypothetical protein